MGNHRAVGRLKGSVGAWVLDRAFDAVGAEALSPAVDQNGFAAFAVRRGHLAARDAPVRRPRRSLALHACGRDRADLHDRLRLRRYAVSAGRGRTTRVTIAVSLARSARYPALEELFYFGPHPGNFAV